MNAHKLDVHRNSRRSRRGFSLMELMIVVVITGVLAAIAIPTFIGYVYRARTSEAVQFLGVIKLKQESYRSEFGQYSVYGTVTDPGTNSGNMIFVPRAVTALTSDTVPFPTGDTEFNELSAKPDGVVRFSYGWAAGGPTNWNGTLAALYGIPTANADHYFIAQAVANLDDDPTPAINHTDPLTKTIVFEVTSFTRGAWFWPEKGWE